MKPVTVSPVVLLALFALIVIAGVGGAIAGMYTAPARVVLKSTSPQSHDVTLIPLTQYTMPYNPNMLGVGHASPIFLKGFSLNYSGYLVVAVDAATNSSGIVIQPSWTSVINGTTYSFSREIILNQTAISSLRISIPGTAVVPVTPSNDLQFAIYDFGPAPASVTLEVTYNYTA